MKPFEKKKKTCYFTENQITSIDFTDVKLLQRFLSDSGKILPRRITGVSSGHQKRLSKVIKTARAAGLLAYKSSF